jgi:hypothetical protein
VRAPTTEQRDVFCSRIILLTAEGRSTRAGQIERRDAFVDGNNDAACFGRAHSTIPAGSFQGIYVIAANTSKGQIRVTEQSGPDLARALRR